MPPPYAQHARYVRDLLEEYVAASKGKFAFEFSDPASRKTEEDKAKRNERDIFGRPHESDQHRSELSELGLQPVKVASLKMTNSKQNEPTWVLLLYVIRETRSDSRGAKPIRSEKDMTSLMRKLTRIKIQTRADKEHNGTTHIEKISQALKQNMAVDSIDLKTRRNSDDMMHLLIIWFSDIFWKRARRQD